MAKYIERTYTLLRAILKFKKINKLEIRKTGSYLVQEYLNASYIKLSFIKHIIYVK